MFQVRDPAIKLFGSDIQMHNIPINHTTDSHSLTQIQPLPQSIIMDMSGLEESTSAEEGVPLNEVSGTQADPQEDANGNLPNMHRSPTAAKPVTKVVHNNRTNQQHRTGKRDIIDHQEKALKKPDKVLPCPRCDSLETKFCYFNNYNVNQPRHFCKNCQRYWTAGGTIRNVPVGAGKRKSKHSALQYCQFPVIPDALPIIQTDSTPAVTSKLVRETLMEEAPLSESLETMLNLKGHGKIEVDSSTVKNESEEEPSVRAVESGEKEYSENGMEQVGLTQQCNGLIPLHYYPVPPWTYQWNPCWNTMAFRPSSITSSPAYTGSATMMAVPRFCTPTIEVPVAPSSPYWGCMPSWVGQKEEFSLVGSAFNGIPSPSSSVSSSTCSGNRSPTLGKHSRDGSTPAEDTVKQNLWVPKTLRINDPEEAAKSSIWSTLGIKSEQNKPIMKGSVFKSFEPKCSDAGSHSLDDNQILRANPAAFSRSKTFQENM